MNITLVKATLADVETFLAIEKSVGNSKTYSAMLEETDVRYEIEHHSVYLIKKDGEVVGTVMYGENDDGSVHIRGLTIDPRFQGQGIGTKTVALLLEELKTKQKIDLVTHPENTRALKIYLSCGFVIKAWKDNYFGDGEPRLVLVKQSD